MTALLKYRTEELMQTSLSPLSVFVISTFVLFVVYCVEKKTLCSKALSLLLLNCIRTTSLASGTLVKPQYCRLLHEVIWDQTTTRQQKHLSSIFYCRPCRSCRLIVSALVDVDPLKSLELRSTWAYDAFGKRSPDSYLKELTQGWVCIHVQ